MSAYRKPSLLKRIPRVNAWRLSRTANKGPRNSASRLVRLVGGPLAGGVARLSYGVNETPAIKTADGNLVGVYVLNEPYQTPQEVQAKGGRLSPASPKSVYWPKATWRVIRKESV